MQQRYILDNKYIIKVPYSKRDEFGSHPKVYADYEKVQFLVDKIGDGGYQQEIDDVMLSLNYVIGKLEKLLVKEELDILLLRFAIYHVRYPQID